MNVWIAVYVSWDGNSTLGVFSEKPLAQRCIDKYAAKKNRDYSRMEKVAPKDDYKFDRWEKQADGKWRRGGDMESLEIYQDKIRDKA